MSDFRPDILALFEVTSSFLEAIREMTQAYPFRHELPADDNYGMAIYSRYKIDDWIILEDNDIPVAVKFSLPSQNLQLYFVHLPPPIFSDLWKIQSRTLKKIASMVNKERRRTIVAGDFNLTPWSGLLLDFIQESQLKHYRPDKVYLPATWPSPFPLLPLDHTFSSTPVEVQYGPTLESDHNSLEIKI
ncbi:MAG: endonuclease/exonuclease/phosphatase family protein [Pseudomonadota bacterium]